MPCSYASRTKRMRTQWMLESNFLEAFSQRYCSTCLILKSQNTGTSANCAGKTPRGKPPASQARRAEVPLTSRSSQKAGSCPHARPNSFRNGGRRTGRRPPDSRSFDRSFEGKDSAKTLCDIGITPQRIDFLSLKPPFLQVGTA